MDRSGQPLRKGGREPIDAVAPLGCYCRSDAPIDCAPSGESFLSPPRSGAGPSRGSGGWSKSVFEVEGVGQGDYEGKSHHALALSSDPCEHGCCPRPRPNGAPPFPPLNLLLAPLQPISPSTPGLAPSFSSSARKRIVASHRPSAAAPPTSLHHEETLHTAHTPPQFSSPDLSTTPPFASTTIYTTYLCALPSRY